MSKNILVTLAVGDYVKIGIDFTFKLMREYADRYGFDFYWIDHVPPDRMYSWWTMEQIYNLLDKYDRLFFVSVDCIIAPGAMNVLDFPEGVFYGFDELPFDDAPLNEGIGLKIWEHAMYDWTEEFPICKDYPKHLYNTGLMLVDKSHQKLFAPVSKELDHGLQDMAVINMRLFKYEMAHCNLYPRVFSASHLWKDGQPAPDFLHIMWYGKNYDADSKIAGIKEFMPRMGYSC